MEIPAIERLTELLLCIRFNNNPIMVSALYPNVYDEVYMAFLTQNPDIIIAKIDDCLNQELNPSDISDI